MENPTTKTVLVSAVAIAAAAVLIQGLLNSNSNTKHNGSSNKKSSKTRKLTKHNDFSSPKYVTGLVNIGNTCFMNAVLQALASLPSLRTYLEARKEIGHTQDSITLALFETIEMLNTIHKRPTSKRLVRMVNTIKAKAAHVLTSQQQDAQELFQIISSQLSEEREKLDQFGTPSLFDSTTMSDIRSSQSSISTSMSSSVLSTRLRRKDSSQSVKSTSISISQPNSSPVDNKNLSEAASTSDDSKNEKVKDEEEPFSMTASLIQDKNEQEKFNRAKSPFMGLLASRVSCVDCEYTAAIRHSTFDNLSLTVPLQYSCSLEDCLDAFINLDTLTDYQCRKCTVMNASKDLEHKIEQGKTILADIEKRRLDSEASSINQLEKEGEKAEPETNSTKSKSDKPRSTRRISSGNLSTKPKVNLAEMEEYKRRIDYCLANNLEMDLSPLELTPVCSRRTTKHSMIAKPPQALCLHLNRSLFTPSGQLAKNPCKVNFDSRLDFTRFTTSGHLNTVATRSMSRRGSIAGTSTFRGVMDSGFSSRTDSGAEGGSNSGIVFPRRGSINTLSASSSFNSGFPNTIARQGISIGRSTIDEDKYNEAEDKVIYRLWAVIVHLGSHNSGHFVTYRRIPPDPESIPLNIVDTDDVDDIDSSESSEKWWRISDEDVQIVDWGLVKKTEAYMLFFEKENQ